MQRVDLDWERVYREMARLIETMPPLNARSLTPKDHEWLGQAFAQVDIVQVGIDRVTFPIAVHNMNTAGWEAAASDIRAMVYRALAVAQANAPASVAGSFIPSGGGFDAFAALRGSSRRRPRMFY